MIETFQKYIQWMSLIIIGAIALFVGGTLIAEPVVHAYPEFASRTNEPCSTCHVNPGGGGPRTMIGLLWAAQGNPNELPELGNILIAPNVTDEVELYDLACSACHGPSGEGLFGITLVGSGINESKIRSTIERGRERSGMPAFDGKFTSEQLEILSLYVAGLASGEFEPAPLRFELPPGKLECAENNNESTCGGGN